MGSLFMPIGLANNQAPYLLTFGEGMEPSLPAAHRSVKWRHHFRKQAAIFMCQEMFIISDPAVLLGKPLEIPLDTDREKRV